MRKAISNLTTGTRLAGPLCRLLAKDAPEQRYPAAGRQNRVLGAAARADLEIWVVDSAKPSPHSRARSLQVFWARLSCQCHQSTTPIASAAIEINATIRAEASIHAAAGTQSAMMIPRRHICQERI